MKPAAHRFHAAGLGSKREQQRMLVLARPVLDVPEGALSGCGNGIDPRGLVDCVGDGDFFDIS